MSMGEDRTCGGEDSSKLVPRQVSICGWGIAGGGWGKLREKAREGAAGFWGRRLGRGAERTVGIRGLQAGIDLW